MPDTPQSKRPTRSPAKATAARKAAPTKATAAKKVAPAKATAAKKVAPAKATAAKKVAPAKVARAARVAPPVAKVEGIRALLAKAAADLEGAARTSPARTSPAPTSPARTSPAPTSPAPTSPARIPSAARVPQASPAQASPSPTTMPAPVRVAASTPVAPVRAIAEPEPRAQRIDTPDVEVPASPRYPAAPVDMDAIDRDLLADRPSLAMYQAPPPPPPHRSRKGLAAAAIVAVLAIGGGAGAFVLASGDKPPTKAAFIAQAEEICRPANAPVAAIVRPTSYPELATAAGTYVTTTRGQVDQLRRLDRPGGDEGVAASAVIGALDGTVTATQKLNEAATGADEAATINATKEAKTAFTDATAQATAYGFGSCGTGLATGMEAVFGGSQAVVKVGFVAKAEAACRASVREIDVVTEPTSPSDVRRFFDDVEAVYNRLSGEFKKLAVPPGDESVVAEIITGIDRSNSKASEFFDAIVAQDDTRAMALEREMNSTTTALDAKLDAYGLAVCGSNYGYE